MEQKWSKKLRILKISSRLHVSKHIVNIVHEASRAEEGKMSHKNRIRI